MVLYFPQFYTILCFPDLLSLDIFKESAPAKKLLHISPVISNSTNSAFTMTPILITGATGKQGGAVIRSLLSRNSPFEILAVTRNTSSAAAQKLTALSPSIKLVQGDLGNPAGIFQNAQRLTKAPIWGVYSVQVISLQSHIHTPQQVHTNKTSRPQSAARQKKPKAKP